MEESEEEAEVIELDASEDDDDFSNNAPARGRRRAAVPTRPTGRVSLKITQIPLAMSRIDVEDFRISAVIFVGLCGFRGFP